jgi:hypothetical protein
MGHWNLMVPHANLLPELPVFKLSALPPCKTKRGRYHRVGKQLVHQKQ